MPCCSYLETTLPGSTLILGFVVGGRRAIFALFTLGRNRAGKMGGGGEIGLSLASTRGTIGTLETCCAYGNCKLAPLSYGRWFD